MDRIGKSLVAEKKAAILSSQTNGHSDDGAIGKDLLSLLSTQ